MSKINKSTIETIKEHVDIVELVESYGITLKRTGNRHVGLCPFHSERSGSFNVYQDSQSYYCFGCQESGDIFSLVMEKESLPFADAVRMLASDAGIEVISDSEEDPLYQQKKRYLEAYRLSGRFYRMHFSRLDESHPAVQNLVERNLLGDEAWQEKFGIGYAPEGYTNLLSYLISKGFTEDELVEFGLAGCSEQGRAFDRFRHRLMWEIRDVRGNIVGFGGRKLNPEDKAKYLNTQQTILYNKSNVLYGLDLARKAIATSKTCHIVEGYTDVMAMHAAGIENVVASSGTAFGDGHAHTIRRLLDDFDATKNGDFLFVFDGDKAGMGAALRTFKIQPSINERSYVISLDNGDPCDIRLRSGDEGLHRALEHRTAITEFVLRTKMSDFDMSAPEQRDAYLEGAYRLISEIPQVGLREDYARLVGLWTGVDLNRRYGATDGVYGLNRNNTPSRLGATQRTSSTMDQGDSDNATAQQGTRDIVERHTLCALLQDPEEVYPILERFNITDLFTVPQYSEMAFDAMSLAGAGEKLSAEDFEKRNIYLALANEPLMAQDLATFANRQCEILLRLNSRQQQITLREDRATRARETETAATTDDFLAALNQLRN